MATSISRTLTLGSSFSYCGWTYVCLKPVRVCQNLQRFFSITAGRDEKADVDVEVMNVENNVVELEDETGIEQLRDISQLTPAQKRRVHNMVPVIKDTDYDKSERYQRKVYGRFGSKSGIDPRVSWPSRSQALELANFYRQLEPPLEERLAQLKAEKQAEADAIKAREEEVARNMAKMDQWIAEYRKREQKRLSEQQVGEEKKKRLLEEAREYFGYYVDPRDAKFQQMLEEKQEEEKQLAKKRKKEKKLEKLAASIRAMAAQQDTKQDTTGSKDKSSSSSPSSSDADKS